MARKVKRGSVTEEFVPTKKQYRVLQKVGVHFTRDELKELEKMLNDPRTRLSAAVGPGSAAYHR